jgi:AraC-like DNA-binding protein
MYPGAVEALVDDIAPGVQGHADQIEFVARLDQASATLHAHPAHLVRTFTGEFGMPPQRLTGRRIERARRLLLDGMRPADVAVTVGFHDQSHVHRHFKRMLATTPARYVKGRFRAG